MNNKKCNKIILIALNTSLLLFCAGLIVIGINSLREYYHYGSLVSTAYLIGLPIGIIFFVASLLFVVALIGIVATVTETKCLIATYCVLQLTTFVLLVAAVTLLFASENTVVGGLVTSLHNGMQNYSVDANVTKDIDYMQQSKKCCGVQNYTDWIDTPWYRNQSFPDSSQYPQSCCQHSVCSNSSEPPNVFAEGCYSAVSDSLFAQFIICTAISAAVSVLLIFGFAAVCVLYHQRPHFQFIGLVEDDAMRV